MPNEVDNIYALLAVVVVVVGTVATGVLKRNADKRAQSDAFDVKELEQQAQQAVELVPTVQLLSGQVMDLSKRVTVLEQDMQDQEEYNRWLSGLGLPRPPFQTFDEWKRHHR